MCIEWWNFYIYSSYFGKFPKLFPKRLNNNNTFSDYQIAYDSILFELLSIVLTYKILTEIDLRNSLINNLMELINEIHQSFLIECDYILSKISNTSMSNLWIKKLKNLILSKKNWILNNNHLKLLHQRNIIIHDIIQHLIGIIPKNNNIDIDTLSYFNNNISNLHLIELSDYFSSEITKENLKISKAFTHIIKKNNYVNRISNKNNNIVTPYLPLKSYKDQKYTLVLDLDETLISFRIGIHGRGIIKLRPGLFDFLNKIKNKYELVVFTAGTKEYADPIIDIIEKKEKYFIKRLYRQHTIYRDNIYIKDLSKLGRDLSKIIIMDNMPQNFCLQKENGILISNYFGQDS
jgi:Dullard-like phosphatase family protein